LLALENASILAAGALLVQFRLPAGCTGGEAGCTAQVTPSFYAAAALLAVDQSCSGVLENLVVKEWSAVVASEETRTAPVLPTAKGSDGAAATAARESALAELNSRMSQIDLGVGVLVPIVVSSLLAHGTGPSVLWLLLLWHAVSAVAISLLAARLCAVCPDCSASPGGGDRTASPSAMQPDHRHSSKKTAGSLDQAWVEFSALPRVARWNVVAYVILYVSVISPSGLTVAWLRANGVTIAGTAALRSAVQVAGFCGTVVAPSLIRATGLVRAAVTAQGAQAVFVGVACLACLAQAVQPFMVGLVMSRLGLWAYDLCERQLVQGGVGASGGSPRGTQMVFAAERCGTQLMGLATSILAMLLSSTEQYYVLVLISTTAVLTSHCLIRLAEPSSPRDVL